ncbi:MAG: hypothetical protein LBK56_14760, partial [Gracilibacteraceae bacterium]|nr:hypothetical protein [Gracilibacteraceae bacterium]
KKAVCGIRMLLFRFCGITTVAGKYQNDVQFLPEIYNSCVPILPAKNIYTHCQSFGKRFCAKFFYFFIGCATKAEMPV